MTIHDIYQSDPLNNYEGDYRRSLKPEYWLCLKCGRIWKMETERCSCGNPVPSKRPGPSETK